MPDKTRKLSEETRKILELMYNPDLGDTLEVLQAGCGKYSAAIIEHPGTWMVRFTTIMDGPNLGNIVGNIVTIENAHTHEQVQELIRDFARYVHGERLCRCGHQG